MIKLSVIVPVYNKVKYIDDCIRSILGQTFTDFELILVNDGSTDGSGTACEKYLKADKRVSLIYQANAGVSAARNTGIDRAKGAYIGFIDSDDTIEPDMYELLYSNALNAEADISVCRMSLMINGKTTSSLPYDKVETLDHNKALIACLKGDLDRSANNKIYKREILQSIRFEGRMYEDILFTCKAFIAAKKTVVQNVAKYNYLVRDSSVSMSSFGPRYLETIAVSAKMVEIVKEHNTAATPYAKAFDVLANISLLNLLLLADPKKYPVEYQLVKRNLKAYAAFINEHYVRKKHVYAFKLFNLSPKLYAGLMYLYCRVTKADAISRV